MNIIDGQIYIALFSPKSVQGGNSIKCGVYKADVGRAPNGDYTISINYDSPVFCTGSKTKIYSFLNLSGSWLYTDGKKLYKDIEEIFNMPGGKEKYWEQVILEVCKKNYQIAIRPCNEGDIVEIDTFNELKAIDKIYDI